MSAIPPNVVGSVLQTNLAQHQVSAVRDNEDSQKSSANRRQAATIDERDTTVGTADSDTQIHSDAEGSGSQGRAFAEGQEQEPEEDGNGSGASSEDEGRHIDLQA
jgi:hypothetical protein